MAFSSTDIPVVPLRPIPEEFSPAGPLPLRRPSGEENAPTAKLLEGCLVEISGAEPIEPEEAQKKYDPSLQAIDPNGKTGRIVHHVVSQKKYIVHTFDGYWLAIPEEQVRPWLQPRPKDRGFDVCWPSLPQEMPMFSVEVLTNLARQGWVVIQSICSDKRREEAFKLASELKGYSLPKEELVQDFLGRGGRAKIAIHRNADGLHSPVSGDRAPRAAPNGGVIETIELDALERCCLELTNIFALLRTITDDALGIECHAMTDELVWLPFANRTEELELNQGRLTEADVDSGLIEDHLNFIQRRRLCLFYLVKGSGEISLYPKEELGMRSVTIPMTGSKILMFRHDYMSFTFLPKDEKFLVLQTWTLEAQPELEITEVLGDPISRSRIRGLTKGPVEPPGGQVNLKAVISRLPGNSKGAAKFWTMLSRGCDAQIRIPHQRFDVAEHCAEFGEIVPGKSMTTHGGFCSERDIFFFDNRIFCIRDEEVMNMAPAQRLILESGLQCLEIAGHSKSTLPGRKCGVFVGDCGSDWLPNLLTEETGKLAGPLAESGYANYATACRLSHVLGLTGPVSSVDTACSSSLVALGLAMGQLRPSLAIRPQDDVMEYGLQEALVVGVSTIVSEALYVKLSGPLMLSKKGRCFTFDSSGDGYERGEGCGVVYLGTGGFTLDRMAVVVGSAINQDGRSATLTAPNGPSQQVCIMESLKEAAVTPNEISIAECHGTGTALGDPIEVGALRKVMAESRNWPLLCTSSKSNIGHLEAGAGLAGFTKAALMLVTSCAPPNCHLHTLNGHLSYVGFPILFETEATDTSQNSDLCGVSSFGFGGTNARADLWAECRVGPHATGKFETNKLDQIHVTCPITMGPIDHLTGEPMRSGVGTKYHADVLRDEFASYEISSHVYSGSYRYRNKSLFDESDESLSPNVKVCIRGTWTGWKVMEEMSLQMDGWYNALIVLGETRYELFSLCLNGDRRQELYPAVNNAAEITWTCGPDGQRKGRNWMIDGRDEEVPCGTPFRIRFKWGRDRKLLIWDRAPSDVAKKVPIYQHVYSVVGSWTSWTPQDMLTVSHDDGTFECNLRIGLSGVEDFQFIRDRDFKQAVYPAKPQTTRMSIPVRGPDELGHGKNWRIRGPPGDNVKIRLRVVDAQITVTLMSDTKGTKVWQSEQGWARREYFLTGSFNGWLFTPMTMDPVRPGIFKAVGTVPDKCDILNCGYLSEFQIVIDEDTDRAYYPDMNGAGSGECIVRGPDGEGAGKHFLVRTNCMPSQSFEVSLDLTAIDRRKTVTFSLVIDEQDRGGVEEVESSEVMRGLYAR